jgi:phenylalanyl-tRNA synthetase beta chain
MPPMINSEPTKLTVNTKNVFIDVTGLDSTKTKLVLTTLITMFSMYCEIPFSIESVTLESELDNSKIEYPNLKPIVLKTNLTYLNNLAGIKIDVNEVSKLLYKFGMETEIINSEELYVTVAVARTDVLHPCDIAEDLAIAYGYDKIEKKTTKTVCFGYQQPINKLTDLVRLEMAQNGYVECLTFSMLSKKDQFTNMEEKYVKEEIVGIFAAKTPEFQVFRKSLLPGLLKTIESNSSEQVIFIN